MLSKLLLPLVAMLLPLVSYANDSRIAVLRFRLENRRPMVEAEIGNGVKATLLVDLGAYSSLALKRELLEELGVTPAGPDIVAENAFGRTSVSRTYGNTDINLSGTRFQQIPITELDAQTQIDGFRL